MYNTFKILLKSYIPTTYNKKITELFTDNKRQKGNKTIVENLKDENRRIEENISTVKNNTYKRIETASNDSDLKITSYEII